MIWQPFALNAEPGPLMINPFIVVNVVRNYSEAFRKKRMLAVQNADIKFSISNPFFVTNAVLNCPQSHPCESGKSINDHW